jgi:hypothetical protein
MAEPVFDINDDGIIDANDKISPPDGVPPSGKKIEGLLQEPLILREQPPAPGTPAQREKKYSSTSAGTIEIMTEPVNPQGMFFWKEEN